MILWQIASAVPSRTPIRSESSPQHQEQLQGGHRKVTSKIRRNVQKQKSPWPCSFKGKVYAEISAHEKWSRAELIKVLVMHNHFQIKCYKAQVFLLSFLGINSELLNMPRRADCCSNTYHPARVLTNFKDFLADLLSTYHLDQKYLHPWNVIQSLRTTQTNQFLYKTIITRFLLNVFQD